MDAYFFVRFLRMMVRVLIPIWFISWAVLLPVTAVRTSVAGHEGLDKYTLGNVSSNVQTRYWAHLILTWVFTSTFHSRLVVPASCSSRSRSLDLVEHQI